MTRTRMSEAVELLLEADDVFGSDGPCPTLFEPGDPRVLLITGDNAGGKSFFARHIQVALEAEGAGRVELLPVSMSTRTTSGMHRVFIYGDENWESTGQLSVHAVLGGLRTCAGREHDHVLVLDEPDVGLAESYQRALGERIANFASDLPEKTVGLVLVTHSRILVRELLSAVTPMSVRVGDDLRPLAEWLEHGPVPRTVEDLEALTRRSRERMRGIKAVMDSRKAESPAP